VRGVLPDSIQLLAAAFDATTEAIMLADHEGRMRGYNRPFVEMWSIPAAILETGDETAAIDWVIAQLSEPVQFVTRVQQIYADRTGESSDRIAFRDGRVIERHSRPQWLDGEIVGRVWTFHDVTAREQAQDALRASEARFRAVFDHSALGIAVLARQGTVLDANSALHRFLGYADGSLHGQALQDHVPPEDAPALLAALDQLALGSRREVDTEQRYIRGDGEAVWAGLTMSRAGSADGDGPAVVAMVQDISTRKSLEAQLTHQAFHDPLTNLANRALFRQRVEQALQRAVDRSRVVVMFLDLDNFKAVNDSHGHAAGDDLLVIAASRLLNATRGSDTVARLGGDEFAILLENVRDDEETRIVAERITRAMRSPIPIGSDAVVVGVSVGIARAHGDEDGANEILRNADVAMYTAKASGKDRFEFFEPAMHVAVVDRLELESELRRAVSERAFVLHYQPLVQLESERIIGVEALVRWRHPRRGLLLPADFIALGEETGLILPIGRWVLNEACRQAQSWWRTLPDDAAMTIAVNVSARQLNDPTFVSDVAEALAVSGLPPARLVLEITETVLLHRTDMMRYRLGELKALGVRLAIDDFGTGYSSLSYLRQFPIDILKIDKAFVDELGSDTAGTALTRTIVGLGGTLGLSTIAEGIEHARQRTALHEFGCDLGQGNLFAEPLAADEVGELMRRQLRAES